ncbi:nicotinic acid mononucleotide adenyltransferase [Aquimarina sp. W85]|uniref:nicotinic acid mononucleotide adenyltransferase n=1 Tax=Aquimarina rhodophyticola TaxID=3342246 RepID=UPI00366F7525
MRPLLLLFAGISGLFLFNACVAEVVVEENYIEEPQPVFNLDQFLQSYEIWYVNIEKTRGKGEVPFLQKAFTVSFKNGTFYANNNLVGIGEHGDGFGLDVGLYGAYRSVVQIDHDLDGTYELEVIQLSGNEIELYDSVTNTSYYLEGYQRSTFDYEKVLYDNIHYFLHEYSTWEKVFTSQYGALNEFDEENFLQFLPFGSGDNFRSSKDVSGTPRNAIYYDYEGFYEVNNVANNFYLKTLTLDYDYLGNEFFELTVINESKIQLYHPASGTDYRFVGRGYVQFKNADGEGTLQNDKKRMKKSEFLKKNSML